MLLKRVITATILIPIVVLGLVKLPVTGFYGVTVLLMLGSAWEWTRLMGVQAKWQRMTLAGMLMVIFICLLATPLLVVVALGALWWVMAFVLLLLFSRWHGWADSLVLTSFMGMFTLMPSFMALNLIRNFQHGQWLILSLLLIVWAADIGAYFSGKRWGRHKLAAHISPGKTVEGLLGGMLCVVAVSALLGVYADLSKLHVFMYVVLAVVAGLLSVVGDLYISMFKRLQGLKDSGALLPGHGGLLDRIDGLLAAAPIYNVQLFVFAIYLHVKMA